MFTEQISEITSGAPGAIGITGFVLLVTLFIAFGPLAKSTPLSQRAAKRLLPIQVFVLLGWIIIALLPGSLLTVVIFVPTQTANFVLIYVAFKLVVQLYRGQ